MLSLPVSVLLWLGSWLVSVGDAVFVPMVALGAVLVVLVALVGVIVDLMRSLDACSAASCRLASALQASGSLDGDGVVNAWVVLVLAVPVVVSVGSLVDLALATILELGLGSMSIGLEVNLRGCLGKFRSMMREEVTP